MLFGPFFSVACVLFHLKMTVFLRTSFKADTFIIPDCYISFKRLINKLSSAVHCMVVGQILME